MVNHEETMKAAIHYAKNHNPVWPYATFIVNASGEVLIRACNATHISPTFHGEIVAINALTKEYRGQQLGDLTLYTTGECCTMCQSAIHWSNIMDVNIKTVVYGGSISFMQTLWDHEINIHSREVVDKSTMTSVKIIGPVLQQECQQLFIQAKANQENIDKYKPTWENMSWEITTFYDAPLKNELSKI